MRNTAQYPITLEEMRTAAEQARADFIALEEETPIHLRSIGGIHGAALTKIPQMLTHLETLVTQMGQELGYTPEQIKTLMEPSS